MTMPVNCKRLAEVDFPLVAVAKYCNVEMAKKTGTIAAIHRWWARRPLGSSRTMNLACLLPDPEDKHCPNEFREVIALELDKFERKAGEYQRKLNFAL